MTSNIQEADLNNQDNPNQTEGIVYGTCTPLCQTHVPEVGSASIYRVTIYYASDRCFLFSKRHRFYVDDKPGK